MNTSFGLNGKYTFNVQNTEITGVNTQLFPQPNFGTSYNKLELSQSLWKNGFGSQIRAKQAVIESANLTQEYTARHRIQDRLVAAENAYWRLAFARRTVEIQEDVLARSNRALDWARRRSSLQLADRSDFLQAQAGYDLNQLSLRSAREEVRNAGRAFNLLRNQEGEVVAETLYIPSVKETVATKGLTRGKRYDILAATQDQRRLEAEAQSRNEDLKPTVDLVANVSWMGRDATTGPAISESFTGAHPNTGIGINLAVPLALGIVDRNSRGNELAKEASRLNLEGAQLSETLGWNELVSKLADAQARLSLLSTIEGVQKEKYEGERQRLLRGRTTTFQALQFETDYATTQLKTLQTQGEVLGLLSQMKLFQGEEQ
jgi:outer membrane protein TolC